MSQQALQNFVAVQALDAIYEDGQGKQNILVELRFKADRSCVLFTRIRNEAIYSRSIEHFVLEQSDCMNLTFMRTLRVLWEDTFQIAQLIESYLPNRGNSSVDVNLTFRVNDREYN